MAQAAVYTTKEECAKSLGVAARTVERYARQAWFPKSGRKGPLLWCAAVIAAVMPPEGTLRTAGSADDGPELGESLRDLQRLIKREELRIKRAKADMDEAEAASKVGLLMPRTSSEIVLALLMSDTQKFLMGVWDRAHQIAPGPDGVTLTADQVAGVMAWGQTEGSGFLNGLHLRIERALANLGTIPDLRTLAAGAELLAAATQGADQGLGGTRDRADPGR